MIVQEPIQVDTTPTFRTCQAGFRCDHFEFITFEFPQVIVWDCLNNYEYDNAIFLAERLHAEGNQNRLKFFIYPQNFPIIFV